MAFKQEIDMLNGPLSGKLVRFALPISASGLLQQLFNSADTAVVGRFAGSDSLAAVSGNGSLIFLLIGLFIGLAVGANVLMAGYTGTKTSRAWTGCCILLSFSPWAAAQRLQPGGDHFRQPELRRGEAFPDPQRGSQVPALRRNLHPGGILPDGSLPGSHYQHLYEGSRSRRCRGRPDAQGRNAAVHQRPGRNFLRQYARHEEFRRSGRDQHSVNLRGTPAVDLPDLPRKSGL